MGFILSADLPSLNSLSAFYFPKSNPDVSGLQVILAMLRNDGETWDNANQIAYALATFKWETANTFTPIHELGSMSYFDKYEPGTALGKRLGNTSRGDGFLSRGRGYVQITGRGNYAHFSHVMGIDIVSDPDKALEPNLAYEIATTGMKNGWFTGKRLSLYVPTGGQPDFVNARRTINGLDHAHDIAGYATTFQGLLNADKGPDFTPIGEA